MLGLSQPPSASPALAPSPGSSMGIMCGPRPPCMAASPGASLNTPGQPGQSPLASGGALPEEQAYREKVCSKILNFYNIINFVRFFRYGS